VPKQNGSVIRFLAISATFSTLLTFAPPARDWQEPFPSQDLQWEAEYDAPKTEYAAGHRGLDFRQKLNSIIKAPAAGEVSFVGLVVDRPVVTLKTAIGYLASFEPACSNLEVGDAVKAGSDFARHCDPETAYEYHCESCIHFSVRSAYGHLSPEYFLAGLKPSVLLG
jgi:murein DD-endopeptidase MepM/ murein hydrolase activator NlpD